jgi:hypothetical protein
MPSITFWNRLEPRARSADLGNALAARVRDAAWFLARQWQLGEFQGEDAGAPAYLRIAAKVAPMIACGASDQPATPLASGVPIERRATEEPRSPDDLSLAVELGGMFDRFLVKAGAADLRQKYLEAFPIPDPDPQAPPEEPRAARLRALWRGRVIDGVAVYAASQRPPDGDAPPGVPSSVPEDQWSAAAAAVQLLVAWVAEVHGAIGAADPACWHPAQLDYDLRVYAGAPTAGTTVPTAVLAAAPDGEGDLEWHAFAQLDGTAPSGLPAATATQIHRAVIPGHVRFRGMPNERFWDFEDGRVDFGGLHPDRRNLASMILMDFMLVHGNDWFLVPFEQPVGTLCRSELTMVDVFGFSTPIPRADAVPAPENARWTMFSTSKLAPGQPAALADYFLLPASAAASVLDGPALEQVRFLRDETANLAWAVEHSTEGHLGAAWAGHARATATAPPPAAPPASTAPLRYRLQTSVPANWIPFQPVKLPDSDQIALARASLLMADGAPDDQPSLPAPYGKILAPTSLPAGATYRVREQEIPREGTRVSRLVRWSRGPDGQTHVWVSRKRGVGAGEGWSGLRFDLAHEQVPSSTGENE